MLCTYCRAENPNNARFCGNCSRPLRREEDTPVIIIPPGPPLPGGGQAVGNVPMVQGTPQVGGAPMVQGTASQAGGAARPGALPPWQQGGAAGGTGQGAGGAAGPGS